MLDEVFWAVFPSIIMHFVSYAILQAAKSILQFDFDLTVVLSKALFEGESEEYASVFLTYLYYCTFVIAVSFVAGHLSRKVVRVLEV